MKKLLVLMLVTAISSMASAVLVWDDGLVQWNIEAGQLIGIGVDSGTYDGFLDNNGLIAPAAGTDGAKNGLMRAAGNLGGIDDFGVVWNVHAEHLAIAPGEQAPGVWFVFDILGVGDVAIYDPASFEPVGVIHVPEPMSMILLGIGGLFLRRRK